MTRFATILTLVALAGPAAGAPQPATNLADPASELQQLGLRVQQDLAHRFPGPTGDVEHGDIPAIGSCVRPTAAERDALTRLVTRGSNPEDVGRVAFGCKEPSGIVVDVAFDKVDHRVDPTTRTGVWRVYRASAATSTATLTTLYEYEGTSMEDFMEWANEVIVFTQLLVDIDGDGTLDAMIGSDQHEGGARRHDLTLRLWRSRDRRIVNLGTYDDTASLAAGSRGAPFVIVAERMHPDGSPELRYRCVSAAGAVEICPEVVRARHIGRMSEIAGWFASGHVYESTKSALPDRELAAQLLTELEIPGSAQAALVAKMPPTMPEVRVARDIARFLAPAVATTHGEIIEVPPPADPRPGKLQALLGDAPCSNAPPRVVTDVEQWMRAHEADALLATGECKRGEACPWTHPSTPVIADSCVDGARGYALATWSYDDPPHNERVTRTVVFSLAPALAPIATSTSHADIVVCAACGGGGTGTWLDVEFHRRGARLVSTIIETKLADNQSTKTVSTFVDGTRAAALAIPAAPGVEVAWGRLREPDAIYKGIVEIVSGSGTVYWQFDGTSWQRIVEIPWGIDTAQPAPGPPAAKFLFDDNLRVYARWSLRDFDPAKWASDGAIRATTRRELVRAGASAAMLARIDAEAASVSHR